MVDIIKNMCQAMSLGELWKIVKNPSRLAAGKENIFVTDV